MSLCVISRDFKNTGCSKIKQNRHPQVNFVCLLNATDCAESDQPPGQAHHAFLRDLLIPEKHTASPD